VGEQAVLTTATPADTQALSRLLAPRAIAVIGASLSEGKLGHAMMTSLSAFPGPVLPVNPSPSHPSAFRSVGEAASAEGGHLDLAVLCVPAALVGDSLRECADAGVGAAVICSGGFAEVGEAGESAQAALESVLATTGLRVLGPNTSGFFRPARRLLASFVPGVKALRGGSVGLVAASGGVNHALAFQLDRVGAGVSVGIGIGGGIDIQAPDVIDYLANDPETRCVALHLETVADGPRLLAAVRACVRAKPVVAMVVGRNDVSEFAMSHTGALATSWAATRALLRQAGAVVVDTEVELVNAASALTATRMTPSVDPGVGLVTGQAGPGLIMADELATRAVRVPPLAAATVARLGSLLPPMTYLGNPVDTGRPGETYPDLLAAVADDPDVEVIGVYGITEPVVTLPTAVAQAALGVPTLIAIDGPEVELARVRSAASGDVPVLVGPSALVHGLAALTADARARARDATGPDLSRVSEGPQLPAGPWHEAAAKNVLDALGFTTPPRQVCHTPDEAVATLATIPGPVAVKILDAGVLHKSDIGGVHLGVRDAIGMRVATESLIGIGAHDFLVESMAPPGRDLILGVRRDPVFGPVVVFGPGGVEAEIWQDTAIRGLPARQSDLLGLPDQLTSRALLDGFRGGAVLDREALATLAANLLGALLANPHIGEIEVNPLRLTAHGLVALDAVIIAKEDSP
jgi:acyl-CoA synthetase (NDP forming)